MKPNNESPALAMLRRFREVARAASTRELGYGMGDALVACFHLGLQFAPEDINVFNDELAGWQAFGAEGGERYYTRAIEIGNDSACRAFESFFKRPPFIYDGKRLHVGSRLRWDDRWVAVTSFGEKKGTATMTACSYNYEQQVSMRGDRSFPHGIERRYALTVEDIREAERRRVAAAHHQRLVKEVGGMLDSWASCTDSHRGEMSWYLKTLTTEQLSEAEAWCKKHERLLYSGGDAQRKAAVAAAPASVREPLATHRREKHRDRARKEIEEAIRKITGAHRWDTVEVSDLEIDARLAGTSIEDILNAGVLVYCDECSGRGKIRCGTCDQDGHTCPVCDGKCRVPVKSKSSPEDYEALLKTLGLRVEGGDLVHVEPPGDMVPRAGAPKEKGAKRSRATLVAEASEGLIREAAYLSSPKKRAAVKAAMGR